MLTTAEVGELLGCSIATLERMRSRQDGPPFVKIGKLVRYPQLDLEAYLQGLVVSGGGE